MNIEKIKIEGIASLAPMAGVTDAPFREICASFGAAYTTSEMVSVKGLIYNDKKTLELISNFEGQKPFAIQLFGTNPEDFKHACEHILSYKPDIIDINMGCPAPKIVKSGAGSALMNNPKLCGDIVKAVVAQSNVPVTMKIRSGFDEKNVNAIEVAKRGQDAGAAAITVHGRTRSQMYSGKVDLNIIKSVVQAVKIPVIGNGDILSRHDAKTMINHTKCAMVSIGRGALGNPWIFRELKGYAEPNSAQDASNLKFSERINVIDSHLKKLISLKGEDRALKEFRKHLAWYLKGTRGARTLRNQIFAIKTYADFQTIVHKLQWINLKRQ